MHATAAVFVCCTVTERITRRWPEGGVAVQRPKMQFGCARSDSMPQEPLPLPSQPVVSRAPLTITHWSAPLKPASDLARVSGHPSIQWREWQCYIGGPHSGPAEVGDSGTTMPAEVRRAARWCLHCTAAVLPNELPSRTWWPTLPTGHHTLPHGTPRVGHSGMPSDHYCRAGTLTHAPCPLRPQRCAKHY